ncbi:MAG TPA: ABC transporter ATP-binding protein [Bacteroidetes bacterium]|nr:ABC transporter ATP-binding protein [Bacteroidota bacterium]
MVKLESVTKTFGNSEAVIDLSLKIPKGEIYGLMGANGSGKTTTLKLIVGLLQPDTGEIWVNGVNRLEHAAEARKLLGYAPEAPYLYDYLSGEDYLRFVGQIRGLDNRALVREVDDLLKFFRLDRDKNELIRNYSYGMKKKISMASALIADPDFLILDEPVEGLDIFMVKALKKRLLRLKDAGKTILLASHVVPLLTEICDRIGILRRGKLIREIKSETFHNAENPVLLETLYEEAIAQAESAIP